MPNPPGSFLWYELHTSDPDAAADFYGDLLGWQVRDSGQPEMDYRLAAAGGTDVAGIAALTAGAAAPSEGPLWLGYLAVEDVDQAAREIAAAGGSIQAPPRDIPGVGRYARVADPQGGRFYVMRGNGEGGSTSFQPKAPGHVGWNELSTSEPDAAFGFYGSLFGWSKAEAMDMGERGVYQILTHGGTPFGAMMRLQEGTPRTVWSFYFNVDDIDAAGERARRRGAVLLHGPSEVPGGDFILIGRDPQGATFSLVGPRTSQES